MLDRQNRPADALPHFKRWRTTVPSRTGSATDAAGLRAKLAEPESLAAVH